jgi:hypothetical protein
MVKLQRKLLFSLYELLQYERNEMPTIIPKKIVSSAALYSKIDKAY